MKAVHLAAGKGTRLRPLTNDQPKPLVELGGTSLLERNIDTLRSSGIEDHVVVTGHAGDQIRDLGYNTIHNDVYDETEMVYSLFCATDEFPTDEDLIISYGDIVYEKRVVDALLDCNSPICVVVDNCWKSLWEERFENPLTDAEVIELSDSGQIQSIGNKPDTYDQIDTQYTGLVKIRSDHINTFVQEYRNLEAEADDYVSLDMTTFLQRLIDNNHILRAVIVEGGWLEVDTMSDLEHYRDLHNSGDLSKFISL